MIPISLSGAAAPSWWNAMTTKEKLQHLRDNPYSQFAHKIRVILNRARKEKEKASREDKESKQKMRDNMVKLHYKGKDAVIEKKALLDALGIRSAKDTKELKALIRSKRKQKKPSKDDMFDAAIHDLFD